MFDPAASTESDVTSSERDVNNVGSSSNSTTETNSSTPETEDPGTDPTTGEENGLFDINPILEAAREGGDVSDSVSSAVRHAIENDHRYATFGNLVAECHLLCRHTEEDVDFDDSDILYVDDSNPWLTQETIHLVVFIGIVAFLVATRDKLSYFYRDFYQYISQDPNSFPNFSFVFVPLVLLCGLCYVYEKIRRILQIDFGII